MLKERGGRGGCVKLVNLLEREGNWGHDVWLCLRPCHRDLPLVGAPSE